MKQTRKTRNFNYAYVIDDIALRQLSRIFAEIEGEEIYTVAFTDGTKQTFNSIEPIINLPNSSRNPIKEIEAATVAKSGARINLALGSLAFGKRTIDYTVSGSEQQCRLLAWEIEEWIDETKSWYSRLATTDFVNFNITLVVTLFMALFVIAVIYVALIGIDSNSDSGDDDSPLSGNSILGFALVMALAIGLVLNIVRNRLFPVSTFAIGYGKKRHEEKQRLREFVGITIVLSFLINILAAIVVGT